MLCWLGFHKWRRLPDMLGSYGMGLEWFQCWECERCSATADMLRNDRQRNGRRSYRSYQVHPTRER
jgi:hypothetical protein